MNAFDPLINLPGLRRLFDLAWRTFGVNPALVSMDGQRVVIFDKEARAQPFCSALNGFPGGQKLCAMCDQTFIQRRRIARARQLLRQESRTCAEIAFECGFGSVQHFNRIFRRLENASPTEWCVAGR
ncbi:MAG: AraC family transcriptional regulator [Verrucomicrobia bacterium]|nr:AraC family transcriptional regulator [Verrucomicrobiota bacterium]